MTIVLSNQLKLYGLSKYLNEFVELYNNNRLPNNIILNGQKGIGKSTLAFHFINYALSINEDNKYDFDKATINENNKSYKLIKNGTSPNFMLVDVSEDKKFIDIFQIRKIISELKKSSFNTKPRFVLIDNIELLNNNSVNALLKVLEDQIFNTFFILINNNKKVLQTLLSRCLNYKISLSNQESIIILEKMLGNNLYNFINPELVNYYLTPGKIYKLIDFAKEINLNISNIKLKDFLSLLIKDNFYKKNDFIKYIIYDYMEYYISKKKLFLSKKYNFFLEKISNTKKFNLDEESIIDEFEVKFLNG